MRTKPSTEQPTDFSDADAKQAIQSTVVPHFQYVTSPAEKLFAREMALTGNLTRSYRLAFPENHALTPAQQRAKGAYLLSKPRVDEMYQYYSQAVAQRMDIREERILQELAAVAFSDVAEFYESDGQTLKNIHTIPAHARHAINQFKTGFTKDGMFTEVKVTDKMKALQLLVNIKNMDQDNKAAKAPQIRIQLASDEGAV